MYTQESLQQTFEIPNKNLDIEFEKAYQNHNNEIPWTRKENKIATIYDGKVSQHNNSNSQDAFRQISGLCNFHMR